MAGALTEHDRERWARLGFGAIEPKTGTDLLFRMLDTGRSQLAAVPVAWPTYLGRYASGTRPARFSMLTDGDGTRPVRPGPGGTTAAEAGDLRSRAIAVPVLQRFAVILSAVRAEAATGLGMPAPARLDVRRGLRDAGLDSLMAVELRNRLQTAVGRPLPATLAFDHPTVDDLARYLACEVLNLEVAPPSAGRSKPRVADGPERDGVDELSDEEAEAQLAAEIAALEESRRGGPDD
jgi:myxalamid-type polyketide synthase MxaC